ncbi:MAG: BamA/TamA family outer membrane protein [Cyanobacteria bacterium]|jgi:hemolysin activation/secretion protein|nr:BamA/TamA family outer membrane protein [Cyanobacteria bacterium GSL.Bin1]
MAIAQLKEYLSVQEKLKFIFLNEKKSLKLLRLIFSLSFCFSDIASAQSTIRSIRFQGNTEFSNQKLQQLVKNWQGQPLTIRNLIQLRSKITDYYIKQGYITSAAYIPEQAIQEGIVTVQVVEGVLGPIQVQGVDNPLTQQSVRAKINRLVEEPLQETALEESLQLLQQDPRFEHVEAELVPTEQDGVSELIVALVPAPPWELSLETNNQQNPDFGEAQAGLTLTNQNFIGLGDRLEASYTKSEGINLWRVSYMIPFSGGAQKLAVGYRQNDVAVVKDLGGVEISSVADTFFVGIEQNLIANPSERLSVSLTFDLRDSQTYLDGEPFPFNLGTLEDDGKSRVRVLRLEGTYLKRGQDFTFLGRAQISAGLNGLNATENDFDFDGSFISWLGSAQYLQQVDENLIILGELATQLTGDALLPLEQLAIGGVDSVRGFERNSRSGDSGLLFSAELQWSVNEAVALVPFFDLGVVWNNRLDLEGINREVVSPSLLSSVGLGLRWQLTESLQIQGDLGIPLTAGEDLEQLGIVQLRYQINF